MKIPENGSIVVKSEVMSRFLPFFLGIPISASFVSSKRQTSIYWGLGFTDMCNFIFRKFSLKCTMQLDGLVKTDHPG